MKKQRKPLVREILFRGKRKDNSEWVKGYIHKMDGYGTGYTEYGIQVQDIPTSRPWSVLVEPETIGQFTGVYDKNGNPIFEGDIVEFYFFDKTRRNGELVEVKNTKTMLIVWAEQSFHMKELFRNYRLDKELGIITEIIYEYRGDRRQGVYQTNECYFVEVIGNAHDNPELLEVET